MSIINTHHLWFLLNFLCRMFPAIQKKDTFVIINLSCICSHEWFLKLGFKIVDLTLVSQYPRLTLAVWCLMFQAGVKSVNRSQPPPRSKRYEGGAATRPPTTWPEGTWTHPPTPRRSCTLDHSACNNGRRELYRCKWDIGTAHGSNSTHRTTVG